MTICHFVLLQKNTVKIVDESSLKKTVGHLDADKRDLPTFGSGKDLFQKETLAGYIYIYIYVGL